MGTGYCCDCEHDSKALHEMPCFLCVERSDYISEYDGFVTISSVKYEELLQHKENADVMRKHLFKESKNGN